LCSFFTKSQKQIGLPYFSSNTKEQNTPNSNLMTQFYRQKQVVLLGAYLIIGMLPMGCTKKSEKAWKPLDLEPYGIPAVVMAPDSSNVESFEMGGQKEVSILSDGPMPYSLQVYAGRAKGNKILEQTYRQLLEVKSNPQFGKVVEQNREGFIYELKTADPDRYSFRYIHLHRDTEVVFTTGLNQQYDLSTIKKLYKSVEQKDN
jgi:hypothetical protein